MTGPGAAAVAVRRRLTTPHDSDPLGALLLADAAEALASLPEPMRGELAALQVRAREAGHAAAWPAAQQWTILVGPSMPVGRLVLADQPDGWHIVDLRVHPAWRGRGIASACLRQLIGEADRAGGWLSLTVAVDNPARALYERLGFVAGPLGAGAAAAPTDVRMRRAPAAVSS